MSDLFTLNNVGHQQLLTLDGDASDLKVIAEGKFCSYFTSSQKADSVDACEATAKSASAQYFTYEPASKSCNTCDPKHIDVLVDYPNSTLYEIVNSLQVLQENRRYPHLIYRDSWCRWYHKWTPNVASVTACARLARKANEQYFAFSSVNDCSFCDPQPKLNTVKFDCHDAPNAPCNIEDYKGGRIYEMRTHSIKPTRHPETIATDKWCRWYHNWYAQTETLDDCVAHAESDGEQFFAYSPETKDCSFCDPDPKLGKVDFHDPKNLENYPGGTVYGWKDASVQLQVLADTQKYPKLLYTDKWCRWYHKWTPKVKDMQTCAAMAKTAKEQYFAFSSVNDCTFCDAKPKEGKVNFHCPDRPGRPCNIEGYKGGMIYEMWGSPSPPTPTPKVLYTDSWCRWYHTWIPNVSDATDCANRAYAAGEEYFAFSSVNDCTFCDAKPKLGKVDFDCHDAPNAPCNIEVYKGGTIYTWQ